MKQIYEASVGNARVLFSSWDHAKAWATAAASAAPSLRKSVKLRLLRDSLEEAPDPVEIATDELDWVVENQAETQASDIAR